MKVIDYDDMMYITLRKLDYHLSGEKIGLRIKEKPFDDSVVNRFLFNGWTVNNDYYLIIDDISKKSIKSLMVLAPCLKGVVIQLHPIPEEISTIINYAIFQNLECYVISDDKTLNFNQDVIIKENVYEI